MVLAAVLYALKEGGVTADNGAIARHNGAVIDKLREIKQESDKEKASKTPECPKCGSEKIVRNGHQSGKQSKAA